MATHSSVLAWRIPGMGEPSGLLVYGVAQSRTRLKRLSSSSSSSMLCCGFLSGSVVKNSPAMQETQKMWVQFLGWEDPLEKEMTMNSSIFA